MDAAKRWNERPPRPGSDWRECADHVPLPRGAIPTRDARVYRPGVRSDRGVHLARAAPGSSPSGTSPMVRQVGSRVSSTPRTPSPSQSWSRSRIGSTRARFYLAGVGLTVASHIGLRCPPTDSGAPERPVPSPRRWPHVHDRPQAPGRSSGARPHVARRGGPRGQHWHCRGSVVLVAGLLNRWLGWRGFAGAAIAAGSRG